MKVILKFAPLSGEGKSQTFFVKLNDVSQEQLDDAEMLFEEHPLDEYPDCATFLLDIKWQIRRVERLGIAQAAMMSARYRVPYYFSGYELPEREEYGKPYCVAYPRWDWKTLVSDDYLK